MSKAARAGELGPGREHHAVGAAAVLGKGAASVLEAVLDRVAIPTLVLAADGAVHYSNEAARRLLARNDGLGLDGERKLRASSRPLTTRLLATIARAAAERSDGEHWACVALPRASGLPELELLIEPLGPSCRDASTGALAVAFVQCPEERFDLDPDVLARAYGFSPKEARVATLLMQGAGPAEIARTMHVSINTVRTHLRGVFTKTGTSRQAELASKLFRGVVGMALAGRSGRVAGAGPEARDATKRGTSDARISNLTPLPGPFPRGGSGLFGAR
jgi:DNA-binding CsgD family transcriptional regulator